MAEPTGSAYLSELLDEYGLGSLASWALDQIHEGRSEFEVIQLLRERPEYRQRFLGNELRRQRGLAPLSEERYLEYERTATGLMQKYGLPAGFYDQPESDFVELIAGDVSPDELNARIVEGFAQVTRTPPEVRQAWERYFGPATDETLAAFFLDPDKAAPVLVEQARTAMVGGAGTPFGILVDQRLAREVALTGVQYREAAQTFGELERRSALFDETASESENLRIEQEGVKAAFGRDGDVRKKIERRGQAREAQMRGGGQQAATQEGVIGAGTARRY